MKRALVACQIVIVALFAAKLLFLMEAWTPASAPVSTWLRPGQANAQPPAPVAVPPRAVRDVTDDGLAQERALFTLLQKKQQELEAREGAVRAEEERVLALKQEVMERIDALKSLETQLGSKLETEKGNEGKRIKDLAKVYEATPPQKAAAMLEKLEVQTAAGITVNMKRDRAGLIWGYLTPEKAVAITNEITRAIRPAAE